MKNYEKFLISKGFEKVTGYDNRWRREVPDEYIDINTDACVLNMHPHITSREGARSVAQQAIGEYQDLRNILDRALQIKWEGED